MAIPMTTPETQWKELVTKYVDAAESYKTAVRRLEDATRNETHAKELADKELGRLVELSRKHKGRKVFIVPITGVVTCVVIAEGGKIEILDNVENLKQ